MSKNIKIQVNPEVLTWAREEAGYTPAEIAKKLKVSIDRYAEWESGFQSIPLGKLKQIAQSYKRQLAVFLLSATPPKTKMPRDFRNLALSQEGLSPDIMLAIRRTSKYLDIARELPGLPYWKTQYQWQTETGNIPVADLASEATIRLIRDKLRISIDDQKKFRGTGEAFRKWRNSLEQTLGLFIYQFDMPEEEIDGFCYADDNPPYAIVVNKNLPDVRKIFTIFHELAHLLRCQQGICQTSPGHFDHSEEYICNEFAGKLLVPDTDVLPIANMEELTAFARQYHVSREVYLRRNLERQLISRSEFFSILSEIREASSPTRRKSTGYASPENISKSTRGKKFYDLVLNAVYENKIDYLSASDALGLGYSYIAAHE